MIKFLHADHCLLQGHPSPTDHCMSLEWQDRDTIGGAGLSQKHGPRCHNKIIRRNTGEGRELFCNSCFNKQSVTVTVTMAVTVILYHLSSRWESMYTSSIARKLVAQRTPLRVVVTVEILGIALQYSIHHPWPSPWPRLVLYYTILTYTPWHTYIYIHT